jgi:hypothetical protein
LAINHTKVRLFPTPSAKSKAEGEALDLPKLFSSAFNAQNFNWEKNVFGTVIALPIYRKIIIFVA